MLRRFGAALLFSLLLIGVLAACQTLPAAEAPGEAEAAPAEEAMTPMVEVPDQAVADGMVTVAKVVSAGPGWIVIHAQADGKPGPVVGHATLVDGVNENVAVTIDESAATDVLYAMLHTDAGEMGTYEFPGPDGPVKDADGSVITPPFNVTMGEEAHHEHAAEADEHHHEEGEGDHMAMDHGVPDEAAAVPNPIEATEESIAMGATFFAANCAVCHGETGEGDGPGGAALDPKPADLHEDHVQGLSDGALAYIVGHGVEGTAMPPWDEVLTEEEIWHVVNFLREFR